MTHFGLNNNEKIKEIPPGACLKMKRLIRLVMCNCGLTCLPVDLNRIFLDVLILSQNSLSHLCDSLKNMTKLTKLRLENNPFECLEEFPFDTLVNIDYLCLDDTNMKMLPAKVGQMVNIKTISLMDNKLKCVPKEFCNLSSDATVRLAGNPLSSPPSDVCYAGMLSIKSYFQSLTEKTELLASINTESVLKIWTLSCWTLEVTTHTRPSYNLQYAAMGELAFKRLQ